MQDQRQEASFEGWKAVLDNSVDILLSRGAELGRSILLS
jgi:hypothetical protein